MQQGVYQPLHLGGHGGGEEEGLLLGGQPAKDAAHVVDEAHVQHPVGLVQHEDLQPGQVDELLAVEVAQAAGGGHQDVHAIFSRSTWGAWPTPPKMTVERRGRYLP